MANWTALKAAIAAVIKTNGNKEITGAVLQSTLNNIVSNLGKNYQFGGVITPTHVPAVDDGFVFYLTAQSGTYSNYDGIVIENPGLYVIYNNSTGNWIVNTVIVDKPNVYNVTVQKPLSGSDLYTHETAIAAVPIALRKSGIIITYLTLNGWIKEQYIASNVNDWTNINNWVKSIDANSELNYQKITGIIPLFTDLFKETTFTEGYYLNSSGTPVALPGIKYSDYIPVVGGNIYNCYGKQYTYKGCWYDSSHNFISSLSGDESTSDKTYTAPSNAAFVRVNVGINEPGIYWVNHSENNLIGKYYADWLKRNPAELIQPNEITGVTAFEYINMYDGIDAYKTGYYLDISGNEHTITGVDITDYIPVIGGAVYWKIGDSFAYDGCFYDSNKNYISGIPGINTNNTEYSFTAPNNAAFVKMNVRTDNWGKLVSDSDHNLIGKYIIDWLLNVPENIGATALNTTNLLESATYTDGYYLNGSGTPVALPGIKYSDYIPVIGGTVYHKSPRQYTYSGCWYDSSHNFISSLAGDESTSDKTYTAPSNAAFVRVNVGSSAVDPYLYSQSDYGKIGKYILPWLYQGETIEPTKTYIGTRDINTYVGAQNHVIDMLIAAKPTAKFIFITHFTEDGAMGNRGLKTLIDAQLKVAQYWGVQCINLAQLMRATKKDNQTNTLYIFAPDELHPATRHDLWSVQGIANEICGQIKNMFPSWIGKKIAWYGTSIPAGHDLYTEAAQYPKIIAGILGCTVNNYSVSGARIRRGLTNGTPIDISFLDITQTQNYQTKMLDLIGTANEPDLFVFDFGINDWYQDNKDFANINY